MEVKLLKVGYCTHPEGVILNNGSLKNRKFPALSVLIKHPSLGYILYDTGYSKHFFEGTKKFPYFIYKLMTPVFFKEEESVINQLDLLGIKAEEIKYIIISHFHADHIAGLKDFPNARFICSKNEYEFLKKKKGFSALKQGFIPSLLPSDFESRVEFVEDKSKCVVPYHTSYKTIGIDLFGDKSIVAIELSGHTIGQIGIVLNSSEYGICFFISDAAWTMESFMEYLPPSKITNLITYNREKCLNNLELIHNMYRDKLNIKIIPSHDF